MTDFIMRDPPRIIHPYYVDERSFLSKMFLPNRHNIMEYCHGETVFLAGEKNPRKHNKLVIKGYTFINLVPTGTKQGVYHEYEYEYFIAP